MCLKNSGNDGTFRLIFTRFSLLFSVISNASCCSTRTEIMLYLVLSSSLK